MKKIILAVMMIGCGVQDYSRPVNETLGKEIGKAYHNVKDSAGEKANKARKYMSDRGFTVEGATKYAEDKGFTKENVQGKLLATRKNIGAYANDKRKAWYRKGIKEMRHGDIDHTSTTANNVERLDEGEARLAKLEAEVAANAKQIAALEEDLAVTEGSLLAAIATLGNDVADEFAALVEWVGAADAELAADVGALANSIEEVEESLVATIELLEGDVRSLARNTYGKLRRLQIAQYFQKRALQRLENRVEELEEAQCYVDYEGHTVLEQYYVFNGHRWHQRVDFNTIYIPYWECGEED